jgi:hypothetical protein
MKTKSSPTVESFVLPSYWASYLINGDHSGLSDDEKQAVDNFLGREDMRSLSCVSCGEESYFANSNDAGTLAGDVMEYSFLRAPAAPCPSASWLPAPVGVAGAQSRIVCFARGDFSHEGKIALLSCNHRQVVPFHFTTADLVDCSECAAIRKESSVPAPVSPLLPALPLLQAVLEQSFETEPGRRVACQSDFRKDIQTAIPKALAEFATLKADVERLTGALDDLLTAIHVDAASFPSSPGVVESARLSLAEVGRK